MRHQRAHLGTLPIQAVLGTVVALWFVALSAEETREPGIRYGWFNEVHTAADLVDASALETLSDALDPDKKITWRVYVPATYDPDEPTGLMVYISPTRRGQMPSGWQPVFDEQNLIFMSPTNQGTEPLRSGALPSRLSHPTSCPAGMRSIRAGSTFQDSREEARPPALPPSALPTCSGARSIFAVLNSGIACRPHCSPQRSPIATSFLPAVETSTGR